MKIFEGGKADGNGGDGAEPKKRRRTSIQKLRLSEAEQSLAADLLALSGLSNGYLREPYSADHLSYTTGNYISVEDIIAPAQKQQLDALDIGEGARMLVRYEPRHYEDLGAYGRYDDFNSATQALKKYGIESSFMDGPFIIDKKNPAVRTDFSKNIGAVNATQLAAFLGSAPVQHLIEKCRDHERAQSDKDPEMGSGRDKLTPLNQYTRWYILRLQHLAEQKASPKPAIGDATSAVLERRHTQAPNTPGGLGS